MSFYRKPSPLEFSYIAADLPNYSPLVNQFFVVGEGSIDTERLQQALNKAVIVNPGIHLKLKGFWGARYWDDHAIAPSVSEVSAPHWNSENSINAPCLGDAIDLRNDTPCKVFIIHAANGTHILFRTHHAITDGRGTVHLMSDVFRILRGEAPLGSTSKLTEWDIAMREERPPGNEFKDDCLPVIKGTVDPNTTGYQWCRFNWNGDKNKFAAKILYACALISRKNFGEGKVLFRIPADLRRYIKEDEGFTIANCSGAIDLEIKEDAKLNELRTQIVRAMRQKMDLAPFTDKQKYAKWLPKSMFRLHPESLKNMHQAMRYKMSGIVSYMGEVDNEMFRCEGFKPTSQFGIPIPFENRPLFVAACSYNDTTNIIIGCPKAVASMPEMESFCQELSNTLDTL
jgi:NRPS condensation-like uncharacterized protein